MDIQNIYAGYGVIKRDGALVEFNPEKIRVAVQKTYLDVFKGQGGEKMKAVSTAVTERVLTALMRDKQRTHFPIEDIQDQVELELMRMGELELAKGFILYREKQAARRTADVVIEAPKPGIKVVIAGVEQAFDKEALAATLRAECAGLDVDVMLIVNRAEKELFDGATDVDIEKAVRMAARTLIERDPVFDRVTARLDLRRIYDEVLGTVVSVQERPEAVRQAFPGWVAKGVEYGILSDKLLAYNLPKLAASLNFERDGLFNSLGVQTLYDRYLVHVEERRIEVTQTFFMRVAMGLALNEIDREDRAIEFYNVLSEMDFMNSTPTLFNSGLVRSQLASCFLTTFEDDLQSIYTDGVTQNALLQKFAGGLGNDWTNVRSLGARIKGTNGKSEGVIPFMKVANDTAVAVNQGGKRKGAVCAYLETWHLDMEAFLELRKNTGDDRRRTHDMNTANWIPDLFMKRVMSGGTWTLFSPNDVPELHDLYGKAFETKYEQYEEMTKRGELKLFKTVEAKDLWRKMLTMLFETGHPWITFKDPCNIRSPQQHAGVVHSSNLCTEITLNTSKDETAVCNIGSVNLVNHLKDGRIDLDKLRRTVRVAMRMLDNVIDLNYYTVEKARRANLRHRPVGLGMMGFHDLLQEMRIPYASEAAMELADETTEAMCYFAYEASSDLAAERGTYQSYPGSLWSKGILPQDTMEMLERERGGYLEVNMSTKFGFERWDELRSKIRAQGMRNSNCVAIAPTATIGNIVGVSASNDPIFANLSVKSNMSGEFTVLNVRLVEDLKARNLWDPAMLADIKYFNGSLLKIERIPQDLQVLYATAFEILPEFLIEAASRRQKWIDQAQSLNLYLANASGRALDSMYKLAWVRGLKTTYYLRTTSATSVEKSTGRVGELNAVAKAPAATQIQAAAYVMPEPEGKVCMMRPGDDGFAECEACQ
ncbi:ribonucleoside-diphosphate reductase subunit alpha [Nostoc sp. CHAB 5834]|nr:ribonucleoside-diphosphate reductase subunit alpha [Nostoc sp. CHAB 5834]